MSTLAARVEQYLGTIADTTALTDQLTAGAKFMSDILPVEKLERYSTDVTDTGTGIAITGGRIVGAHKSGYSARFIKKEDKARASDSSSLHYATTRSPVYYIDTSKAFVIPGGGSVNLFTYPTAAFGDSTIAGFPTEYEHGVILWTAIQQAIDKVDTAVNALNALSYTAPTPPTPPADFSLSASAPAAPIDASYSYSNASLGTYTATTIGALGTVPTYTKPTSAVSYTNAATYISTDEEFEKARTELEQQTVKLNEYRVDIENEVNEFNKELEIYKTTVQNAFEQARLDQERLMSSANKTTDLNLQNAAQTLNAAIELYKTKLDKFSGQINLYAAQVNAEVNAYSQLIAKFSGNIQLYSSQVQNAFSNYTADQQRIRSEMEGYKILLDSLKSEFDNYLKAIV